MRQAPCKACGTPVALSSAFAVDGQIYCEKCADHLVADMPKEQRAGRVGRVIDPTICAVCSQDYGSAELPTVGALPVCPMCREKVYNRPYPGWLKASLAGLVVLLFVALGYSGPYFRAGKALVIGERLVAARKFSQALPYLTEALKTAPQSEEAIELAAKAYLLTGDPKRGYDLLQTRQKYEITPLFNEVKGLLARVDQAFGKAEAAQKAANEGKTAEGAKLMREAANMYPEAPQLQYAANSMEAGVAFEKQDYDTFLALAEKQYKSNPDVAITAAGLASALACKYAVTGDLEFRKSAEEYLEKSRQLAEKDPAQKEAYNEYAERIRYRLDTRVIIDKPEYDRRFRAGKQPPKG